MFPEPMAFRHTGTRKRRMALAAAQVGVAVTLLVCMAIDGDAETARFRNGEFYGDRPEFPVSGHPVACSQPQSAGDLPTRETVLLPGLSKCHRLHRIRPGALHTLYDGQSVHRASVALAVDAGHVPTVPHAQRGLLYDRASSAQS